MSPERHFIRMLHLPFTPFLQQTLKLKNWTLCFFLFGLLTSQDLGATLNASISQSSRCCELLSHSQTLISPFIFSFIVDQSSVIMYLCIHTTCYDTRLVLLIDSHIG